MMPEDGQMILEEKHKEFVTVSTSLFWKTIGKTLDTETPMCYPC